jgi:transposase
LLYEFGVVLPQGRQPSIEAAKAALASLGDQTPAMLTDSLQDQLSRLSALDDQIARLEQRWLREFGQRDKWTSRGLSRR